MTSLNRGREAAIIPNSSDSWLKREITTRVYAYPSQAFFKAGYFSRSIIYQMYGTPMWHLFWITDISNYLKISEIELMILTIEFLILLIQFWHHNSITDMCK